MKRPTITRFRRLTARRIVENLDGVLDVIYAALYGSRDIEPRLLKHQRAPMRQRLFTPPRLASLADPPPPGEGDRARGPAENDQRGGE